MADPFESFRRFEDHVLDGLSRGDRSAQKSKRLLGVINQTLVATHQIVIARLEKLQRAESIADANEVLEALRLENLTETFRLEGLCDLLEGLGTGLLARTWAARQEGSFADGELNDVEEFAHALYDREAEVARIYSDALSDLTALGPVTEPSALDKMRRKAASLEKQLTAHVSDFDAKADRFMRLSIT
ncbi:MAG: hypothetical protein KY462_15780 [Actinobacteria bacterium]|nr:hypothetical protein [Actinomycetota bacterium]